MFGQKSAGSRVGTGCAVLFLLPFATVGVVSAGLIIWQIWNCWTAQSWVERPCTLLRVELKTNSDGEGTTYKAEADYQYEFNERQYKGDRVWFGTGSDNVGNFHHRVHQELTSYRDQGRPFRCFVDPNDPSVSVLYRELRLEMLAFGAVFALMFGGVGVGGLVAIAHFTRKIRRMNEARELRPSEPWTWDDSFSEGSISPAPTWIVLAVFATFWNLLSWTVFFGSGIYIEMMKGPSTAWLFLAFPAVGLLTGGFAVSVVHRHFRYGVPRLNIRPWPVFLGTHFEGSIDFPALRPASPEFEVVLTATKKSTSDSDNSVTLFSDKTTFANTELGESFRIAIPANQPRSARLNDASGEETAEWKVKITGSEGPSDFEATYSLPVFERTAM